MLHILSKSPSPDIPFLHKFLSEYTATLGHQLQSSHYEPIIRTLANADLFEDALSWINRATVEATEAVSASLWDVLMERYIQIQRPEEAASIFMRLKSTTAPSLRSFQLYVHCISLRGASETLGYELDQVLQDLRELHAEKDPIILQHVLDYYQKGQLDERCRTAAALAQEVLRSASWDETSVAERNALSESLLRYLGRSEGLSSARSFLSELENLGYQTTSSTLTALLRGMQNDVQPSDLRELEDQLDVEADGDVWAILIDRALEKGYLKTAVDIYNDALTSIKSSPTLASPFFRRRTFRLDISRTVLDCYQDILLSDAPLPESEALAMYKDLIMAVAEASDQSVNKGKVIVDLLLDMRNRSFAFGSTVGTQILITSMRSAESYDAAFNIYTHFRALGTRIASQAEYTTVINEFLFMPINRLLAPASTPPSQHVFNMIKDMMDDGFDVDLELYTEFFRRLRNRALGVWYGGGMTHRNPNAQLLQNLRRGHAFFRMYAPVTPDVNFLNILMDAYSRTGGLDEAISIWKEELVPPRIYDGKSISIILDTCGHYRAPSLAFDIWSFLIKREKQNEQFALSEHAWGTWLECLCRLDLADEAGRVLVDELGTPQSRTSPTIPPWRIHATQELVHAALKVNVGKGSVPKRRTILDKLRNAPDIPSAWLEIPHQRSENPPDTIVNESPK